MQQGNSAMSGKQPKRKPHAGVDELGRMPLHYAAADGDITRVQEQLRNGADPNAQDDNGWTPLHFAAQANSASVTQALLNAGAEVGIPDAFGNTPLFRAVFCSRGEGVVIRLLREAGADPISPNKSGVSPVQLARTISNFDLAQYFSDLP
jgi:ankyrin repeat protein